MLVPGHTYQNFTSLMGAHHNNNNNNNITPHNTNMYEYFFFDNTHTHTEVFKYFSARFIFLLCFHMIYAEIGFKMPADNIHEKLCATTTATPHHTYMNKHTHTTDKHWPMSQPEYKSRV